MSKNVLKLSFSNALHRFVSIGVLDEETKAVVIRYNNIVTNEVAEINDMFRNFPQVSVKQATYGRD